VRRRGIRDFYCLGDLGGFGPNSDKVFPLIRNAGVNVIQGNYDDSVGNDLPDCQCGYTDPKDNYVPFALLENRTPVVTTLTPEINAHGRTTLTILAFTTK
jgi:hypothetical protein